MGRIGRALAGHWQLLALTCAIFALWQTPLVLPLKILIVFLHELSHALATLATGGRVASLTIDPQQGGAVISYGGSRFIILSAGYTGSLLIGTALFAAAVRTRADRALLALLGLAVLGATLLYVRTLFAMLFGLAAGAAMLACARYLGRGASDLALRVIGLSSMIYVPYDIFSDTIARAHLDSDARMLAAEFGGPTVFWGGLWLVLSLAAILACLRWGLGAESNIALRRPGQRT